LSGDVMIAVDPRKAGNTAAVLDPVPGTVIEPARFADTADGYAQLTAFAGRWSQRRWAVGGCFGAGRSLAQRLVADGEMVLDVPAKLAARVRVCWCGHGRTTGKDEAVPAGLAALDGTDMLPVTGDDALVSWWLLCGWRGGLTALRTQAVGWLHRLLAELPPGGMRRELTADKAQALPAIIRPAGDVGQARVQIACGHLAGIRALDARITCTGTQIAALVTAAGTGLTGLSGIGPVIAGRILAEVGDVARFATKDAFASYNGTAPIGVSPGGQIRHRLSRAGNRRTSHALHLMAVTQIRYPPTPGRRYHQRKRTQGKTPKQALRCLKRRLPGRACCQLPAGRPGTIAACRSPTTPPPTRPTSTSPASRSHRAAPPSRPPPRPAPNGSPRWTGKTTASPASRSSTPAPGSTRNSSRKPKSPAKTAAS
jgi:transposase